MQPARPVPWLVAVLLVIPLAALVGWIAWGAAARSFGPPPSAAPAAQNLAPGLVLPGFPPPDGDFPADRMHERVDGAADALRAEGCGRILFWQVAEPPSELEVLVFDRGEGAARVLARDAGPERTAGPGDEASVADGSILFRRAHYYARLLADPGAPADAAGLLELAARVDGALVQMLGYGATPGGAR